MKWSLLAVLFPALAAAVGGVFVLGSRERIASSTEAAPGGLLNLGALIRDGESRVLRLVAERGRLQQELRRLDLELRVLRRQPGSTRDDGLPDPGRAIARLRPRLADVAHAILEARSVLEELHDARAQGSFHDPAWLHRARVRLRLSRLSTRSQR